MSPPALGKVSHPGSESPLFTSCYVICGQQLILGSKDRTFLYEERSSHLRPAPPLPTPSQKINTESRVSQNKRTFLLFILSLIHLLNFHNTFPIIVFIQS